MSAFDAGRQQKGINRRELLRGAAAMGTLALLTACSRAPKGSGEVSKEVAGKISEFQKRVEEVRVSLVDFKKNLDIAAVAIPQEEEMTAESLRVKVRELIHSVSDNSGLLVDDGDVMQLGAEALKGAEERRDSARGGERFEEHQRETLTKGWQERANAVSGQITHLKEIRARIVELLRAIQGDEPYIGELAALEQFGNVGDAHKQAVENSAQKLVDDLRRASGDLDSLIGRF